jgi:hypothetical protein
LVTRRIKAFLQDPDAPRPENPIHSTDTAQRYGFAGALVGGANVYGFCVPSVIEALGETWLDHGWAEVSFRRPVYPNESLRVRLDAGELSVVGGDDEAVRISGRVGVGDAPWLAELARPGRQTPEPAADPLPELTPDNVPVGEDLRARAVHLSGAEHDVFLRDKQGVVPPLFEGPNARVHPAWLASQPIFWLHHSFSYGPAIHTASRIQQVATARVDQTFTVAGCCVDAFERKGHHYVVNDVDIVGEARTTVTKLRHTAIYRVAPRQA